MSRPVTEVLLHHIQRLARHETDAEQSDAELLRRFCATGDGDLFALLAQRHGVLVWRVCTAALPCRQDAEDVFQATFLVLARQARSIRKPGALACWLHGVAARLARKVRGQNARRAQTGAALDEVPARPLDDWTWREVRQVMHEELARLPEKLRLPILLCHLEEQTQEAAAQALGWTVGQLRGRLLRGRALLHRRLSRRGLAPAVPLLPPLLLPGEAAATPPSALVAALRVGVAATGAPETAATVPVRLAQQFTRQAAFVKGWVVACCAVVLLLTGVLGVLALQPAAPSTPPPAAAIVPALDEPVQDGTAQEKQAGKDGPLLKDLLGDPLPAGALLRLGTLRFRNGGFISMLAFGAGGKELICGGWDRTVRRWDSETGAELQPLTSPDKGLDTVALTPDGKTLIGGKAGTIHVWDMATAKKIKSFSIPGVKYFRHLAAASDAHTLAAAGEDKTVRLWDWTTGKELRQLHTYPQETTSLAFSPNSKLLASAAYDKTARIHEVDSGKEVLKLKPKAENFQSLCFSPDGKVLLTGEEKSVCTWDAQTGQLLHRWDIKGNAYIVLFAPGGQQFAAGASNGMVYLWDMATDKKLHEINGHADNVHALAFSPDGKKLASGGSESSVRLWDTTTGKQLNPLLGHQERVTAVAVAPDGKMVATSAWDQTIRLWDAHTGKEVRKLTWPPPKDLTMPVPMMNRDLTFSPDGKWLAAAGNENKVWLWDLAKDDDAVRSFPGTCVAYSPDGKHLAVAGWNTNVVIYDLASGKKIRDFKGHLSGLYWVRFTPDGKSLVTASDGAPIGLTFAGEVWDKNVLWVWDVATGKARLKFGGERCPSGLALSPDGRTLAASAFLGKTVNLWEMATGQQRAKLESGHEDDIFAVAFAPRGKLLAIASMDRTCSLWQIPAGKKIHTFQGHRSWVLAAAFFPDSKKLLTGSLDTTGVIWKVPAPPAAPAPPPLKTAQLTHLWNDLGGDAWDAYRAVTTLADAAEQSVPFLAQKVKPAAVPDAAQVAKLIAELDSKTFAVRQHAIVELEKMGELVAPQLDKALAKPASVEMALRLQKLLDTIAGQMPGSEKLRGLRAVETLEYIGTPPARSLLQALSQGAPGAALTREAKAALTRLG